jgi:hypothetical protein
VCSDCNLFRGVCSWSMLDIFRRTGRCSVSRGVQLRKAGLSAQNMSPRNAVKSRQSEIQHEGNRPCNVSSYTVHIHCETCCESCGDGRLGRRLGCWRPSSRERLNYEVGERRSPQDLAICIRLHNYEARERFGHYCPV